MTNNWHRIPTEVTKGLGRALIMMATRQAAVEYCEDVAERLGADTSHVNPAKWLERARKDARKVSLREYNRVCAIQQYHWKKLVHEMRAINQ